MHVVVINNSAVIQKDQVFIYNHVFCVMLPSGSVYHFYVL